MSANSKIEWTEATWNPVRGCSRISPGCVNCYAERMAARDLPGLKSPTTGEPFAIITPSGPRWTGKMELIPHMLDVPLKRKKPTTYFVNSMSDLFHEALPDEDIAQVFEVMYSAEQHTFQVLTKRADRMRAFMLEPNRSGRRVWPPRNIHLGVSVENQEYRSRIDLLRKTPAAVRFVSFEPLLENLGELNLSGIDLGIWGGESGPGARACDIAWIRSGMRQAERDGCLNFVKQIGARPWDSTTGECDHLFAHCGHACECCDECPRPSSDDGQIDREKHPQLLRLKDRKGGDMSEWPRDLRVRQMPEVRR